MDLRKFSKPSSAAGTVPPPTISPAATPAGGHMTQPVKAPPSGIQDPEPAGDKVIEGYLEFLQEHDISKQDVLDALDAIITTGELVWSFDLLGKIPVVLQMRPAWVNEQLMQRLEHDPPKTDARFFDLIGIYNLAGSLLRYDKQDFTLQTTEDLDLALSFINSLPYILQNRLIKQMAVFDRLVAVATSDWAVENFSKPLSEK